MKEFKNIRDFDLVGIDARVAMSEMSDQPELTTEDRIGTHSYKISSCVICWFKALPYFNDFGNVEF